MKKILFSIITVVFIIPVLAQESVSLKMNLEKSKLYRFKSVSEQTVTQTVNNTQQTVETDILHALSIKMLDMTPDFMVTEVSK